MRIGLPMPFEPGGHIVSDLEEVLIFGAEADFGDVDDLAEVFGGVGGGGGDEVEDGAVAAADLGGVEEGGVGHLGEDGIDDVEGVVDHLQEVGFGPLCCGVEFAGAVAGVGLASDVVGVAFGEAAADVEDEVGDAVALRVGTPVEVLIGELIDDAVEALAGVGEAGSLVVDEHAGDAGHLRFRGKLAL